jgi:hypothetical protein
LFFTFSVCFLWWWLSCHVDPNLTPWSNGYPVVFSPLSAAAAAAAAAMNGYDNNDGCDSGTITQPPIII